MSLEIIDSTLSHSDSMPKSIMIWIHGTRSHDIFPPTHIVKKAPSTPSSPTHNTPSYSPLGLHNLLSLDKDLHVSMIARALCEANSTKYTEDHTYLFGWTGGCTPEARTAAGIHLYQELKQLTQRYSERHDTCPPITIISHSHGGNVALESALLYDGSVSIEKLILLACPVQEKTKPYTQSALFKYIYAAYSDKDYFQILDMQGLHPMWETLDIALRSSSLEPIKNMWRTHKRPAKLLSERLFPNQANLRQACIKWDQKSPKWSTKDLCIMEPFLSQHNIQKLQTKLQNYDQKERSLMHIEFLFPTFLEQLPHIINTLEKTTPLPDSNQYHTITIKI